jgi:NAD(P)-dependent dehydrogenase (short-subunit alcohol dehydrogenase family)
MESPFRPDVLKEKVELVTGGGSGICHEIAAEFTHHGAQVTILGCHREVLDKAVDILRSHCYLLLLPQHPPRPRATGHPFLCNGCGHGGPVVLTDRHQQRGF